MKTKLFTLPNLLTCMNLLCGSLAVMYCFTEQNLKYAFFLIIIAAVFDFLDGFAARLLKAYSDIGRELDSLADMVSFGLAPAAMMYVVYNQTGGDHRFIPLVFLITLFSALRLARFNVEQSESTDFIGLPTPAATLFIASSTYLFSMGQFELNPYVILAVGAAISALLVCNLRLFSLKFKTFSFKGNELRFSFLALALILIIALGVASVPIIIGLYILISLVCALLK